MLLIGYATEKTFRFFADFARGEGAEFDVLDLSELRSCPCLRVEETDDDLVVTVGRRRIRFGGHRAFYQRSYWTELGDPIRNAALTQTVLAIASYLQRCGGQVINRPGTGMSNINKFCHTRVLQRHGFRTPETWIFGDPDRARSVLSSDGDWVSKSCSSVKTRAAALDGTLFDRLDRLVACPSLFQRRVRGSDVRAHVVGGSIFAESIQSGAVDYRFADSAAGPNQYSPCEVPPEVAVACHAYCRAEGLTFAGIDFKVAETDGSWIALEANQMPGYESYDRRQSGRISRALLALLAGDTRAFPEGES